MADIGLTTSPRRPEEAAAFLDHLLRMHEASPGEFAAILAIERFRRRPSEVLGRQIHAEFLSPGAKMLPSAEALVGCVGGGGLG